MKKVFQEFNKTIRQYFFSNYAQEKTILLYSIQAMLEKNEQLVQRKNKIIFKKRKDSLLPLCLAIFYADRHLFDLFLHYTPENFLIQHQKEIIDYLFDSRFHAHPYKHIKISRNEVISTHFFRGILNKSTQFFSSMEDRVFLDILAQHLYRGHFAFKADLEFLKPHYLFLYNSLDPLKQYQHNIYYILSSHIESAMYMIAPEKYQEVFSTFSEISPNCVDNIGNSPLMNSIKNRNLGYAGALVKKMKNVQLNFFNHEHKDALYLLCEQIEKDDSSIEHFNTILLLNNLIEHNTSYLDYYLKEKEYICNILEKFITKYGYIKCSWSETFSVCYENAQLKQKLSVQKESKKIKL